MPKPWLQSTLSPATYDLITPRKARVLRSVAESYTRSEIALRACIPRTTVRTCIQELESVTQCSDMRELPRWWNVHREAWVAHMAEEAGTRAPHSRD